MLQMSTRCWLELGDWGPDLTLYTTAGREQVWGTDFSFEPKPESLSRSEREGPQKWKRCPDCGLLMPWWRRRHVRRDCPGYSKLWAGDVRMKLFAALRQEDGENVRMVTVTAPGVECGLLWDLEHCSRLGKHRHSGRLGCRVDPDVAAAWNKRAPGNWSALHRESRIVAGEKTGSTPRVLARTFEFQSRGLLHVHVVLAYTSVADRRGCDAYVDHLARRASVWKFGFVDRKRAVKGVRQAAAYLSSYFVDGKHAKMSLTESVRNPDMPRSIVYVRPELSQKSGITMRSLRLRRYLFHKIGTSGLDLCRTLQISLEDAYLVYQSGFWGKAFLTSVVESRLAPS